MKQRQSQAESVAANSCETVSHDPIASEKQADILSYYMKAFTLVSGMPLELMVIDKGSSCSVSHANAELCKLMMSNQISCSSCRMTQQQLKEKAHGGTITLKCYAGLHESAIMLNLGDHKIAILKTGHILFEEPTEEVFHNTFNKIGEWRTKARLKQAKAAWFSTPVMERSRYEAFLILLETLAGQMEKAISESTQRNTQIEDSIIHRAKQFIFLNANSQLALPTVAKAVGLSPQHFCKVFKQRVGITFKAYVSDIRLEKARSLLDVPGKRINEVAFEAGFKSISQFNRTFFQKLGITPSAYRNSVAMKSVLLNFNEAAPH